MKYDIDWDKITQLVDKHGYMSGVDRMSERVKKTAEVFTPTKLVIEILQEMDIESFGPGKTVLDPACGDGQFLVAIKHLKMMAFGMSEEEALDDIYGVDIMRDNVDLCKQRLNGGHIMMGNTLDPNIRLDDQTEEEHLLIMELFSGNSLARFLA